MKLAAAALVMSALCSPSALADTPDLPAVGPGSSIFWVSQYDGGGDRYRERVHQIGPDWVLFESLFDSGYDDELEEVAGEDFFLIFSGIEFYSCDEDKFPSAQEREAMAGLFPLQEGKSATMGEGETLRTMTVGEATPFFLMGAERPAHNVRIEYPQDDSINEDLTILDNPAMTVVIAWDDSSKDRVLAINSTRNSPLRELTDQDLGHCAAFLAAEKNNQ